MISKDGTSPDNDLAAQANVLEPASELGAFLAVFAKLLLDNVLNLEETVSSVTDLIMRRGRPDREMVVTLQSFDRLKQEFEALGVALTHFAETANSSSLDREENKKLQQKIVASINVADLKDRLLRRLRDEAAKTDLPAASELAHAELGVDVIF